MMANVLSRPQIIRIYLKIHKYWYQSRVANFLLLFRNFWLSKLQKLLSHSLNGPFSRYVTGG